MRELPKPTPEEIREWGTEVRGYIREHLAPLADKLNVLRLLASIKWEREGG